MANASGLTFPAQLFVNTTVMRMNKRSVCLIWLPCFSKSVNEHDELYLAGPLIPEPMLQIKENVLVFEVFGNNVTRSHGMLLEATTCYQKATTILTYLEVIF